MIEDLAALATLRFDWADAPDHVWRDSPYHVDGLHADALAAIDVAIRDAAASDGPSPIGLVLQGQKGVGKTHLLGLVRRQTHRDGRLLLPRRPHRGRRLLGEHGRGTAQRSLASRTSPVSRR